MGNKSYYLIRGIDTEENVIKMLILADDFSDSVTKFMRYVKLELGNVLIDITVTFICHESDFLE